jgi:hypothetical protein
MQSLGSISSTEKNGQKEKKKINQRMENLNIILSLQKKLLHILFVIAVS